MTVILWFERGSRRAEHPALARAAASGEVRPLRMAAPARRKAETGPRQKGFGF